MKLRLGVVGVGGDWETRHGPALRALSDRFEVRAVCEAVAHRGQQVAQQFNARLEDGFQALTCREDVDAILLLSGDWHGLLPIIAACEHGKAVYCAVSLDSDPERAKRIKGCVEDAGIAFVAELPCRQAPATLRLKELIATQLGQPRLIFCHQRRVTGGSNRQTQGVHTQDLIEAIDWCRYIVGREPTAVVGLAHETQLDHDQDDYQMMSLDFSDPDKSSSGVLAQISCGRYIPSQWHEAATFRPPADMQVACQRGIAFIDLPYTLIWFDSAGRHMESLESERPVGEQLLTHFHRAVTSLIRDTSSLEDAYRAFWIAFEAQASHREGKRIPLSF